jgi:hypothetical protein
MTEDGDTFGDLLACGASMLIVGLGLIAVGLWCLMMAGALVDAQVRLAPASPYQVQRFDPATPAIFGFGALAALGSGGWLGYAGVRLLVKLSRGKY